MKGTWDSIHVVEVNESKKNASYKLTSTVMLSIETETEATGTVTLSGSLTRQLSNEYPVTDTSPHVCNIGRMVEDMEYKLRTTLETIYFGKTKDIANELRQAVGTSELKLLVSLQAPGCVASSATQNYRWGHKWGQGERGMGAAERM